MGENDIVILENSVNFLRFQCIWPKNEELSYRRKNVYAFVLVTLSTSILLWGSLAHMIMALYEKNGSRIELDLSIIISIIGTYYFNFSYLVKVKKVSAVFRDLSNFKLFGKPSGFSNFNRRLNNFSKFHQIYLIGVVLCFFGAPFLEFNKCKTRNEERGTQDICGLTTNVWFPFDVDYFPVKQIILLIQVYSVYFSYGVSSTISFSVMESIEHVIFRMAHVKSLFVKAINAETYIGRRQLLNECIKYHNFIISSAKKLGELYSACVFVHVLLTGIILGCSGYQLLESPYLNTIGLFVGWFASLLMVAYVGQRLADECSMFRETIYNIKWYELELDIQRDLILVLLRSQKPVYLRAGAFGFMSYQIVVSILKTSYSIVSLMKGTS